MPETVLVTGADGFIGTHLCGALQAAGYPVRAATRTKPLMPDGVVVGEIGVETDWSVALRGIEVVIHLAARAHVLKETSTDPLALFRQVNTAGTTRLAEMAIASGVRRLIFVSSIGVNGEQTPPD